MQKHSRLMKNVQKQNRKKSLFLIVPTKQKLKSYEI